MTRTLYLSILYITLCHTASATEKPVRVFILAGQSNMQGQGVVDLDDPKNYNGGRGTLLRVMREAKDKTRYAHIMDANGDWVVRDDVHVRYKTKNELKKGPLSIGFAGYPGKHHIGPEFQFGHVVGAAYDEPVLLIKTAWGGKSLFKDFRPPSAGGETGPYYTQMIAEINEALAAFPKEFPQYKSRKLEVAGFVWFQGWNDMYNETARKEYEINLAHLINDVRKEVGRPKLPVVIGELGNGGPKAGANMLAIRKAQADTAKRREFAGTVVFVKTTAFARPAADSPNKGHGHHWFGNAESYFLIGDALGRAMVRLSK
jgi:sugar phosphate isomerase/epimerase